MSCSRFSMEASLAANPSIARIGTAGHPPRIPIRRRIVWERYPKKCRQIWRRPSLAVPHRWLPLMQHSSESLNQQRLLFGEDGAEVEDKPVVFDAGDDGDACRSAAQALFEFCRGVARTRDSNDFRGKSLRRSGSAPGERAAIRDIDFDLIQWKFRTQLADEILRPALQLLRSGPNHSHSRNFIPCSA